ncbi:MAG: serine/threonine protein kinase [Planctomycetota bacterium]|jgi:serine/threonine protein kinase
MNETTENPFDDETVLESLGLNPSMPGVSNFLTGLQGDSIEGKSVFKNYEIIDELPRGGQAVVYKATHLPTQTTVAIKVLLPTLLASAQARYYFERESRLIARMEHPNIVHIRDSGIVEGQYFFVMEYIHGQNLKEYVQSKDLSLRKRVQLFLKICSAIQYAHQQGIIHRDLKFANILVDNHGEPHILDFGLAKALDLAEEDKKHGMATVTGQWAGSLSNMSPEQAAGKPDLIDMRTDIYSLGMILYHLLLGQYPYEVSGSVVEVLKNIQIQDPVRPRSIDRRLASDLEVILMKSIAKSRDQRYQSVSEFSNDLENWLQARPISVKAPSTLYLLQKIIQRHKYVTAVLGLLLIIILSFSYISFDLYQSAKISQQQTEYVAAQQAQAAVRNLVLSRQMLFIYCLNAWQKDRPARVAQIMQGLTPGSKEWAAMVFLMNPAPLHEKLEGFSKQVPSGQEWFKHMVMGEYYFKKGEDGKALEAYQKSYKFSGDLTKEQVQDNAMQLSHLKDRLAEYESETLENRNSVK